jgi:hypothetical protein
MKKIFSILAVAFSAFIALPAAADCSGDTCMDMSTPTVEISNLLDIDVLALGASAGVGEVTGLGQEFAGRVDRVSNLTLNTEIEASFDGCRRDCGDVSVEFEGTALENLSSVGAAISTSPGDVVSVGGANQALSNLGLELSIGDFNVDVSSD